MPAVKDLTGKRFGDLLVLHKDEQPYVSPGGVKTVRWVVRCERCGRELSMLRNTLTCAKSCGCVRSEKGKELGAKRQNYKVCPVCGKQFPCPPSDKTVTCSRECSSVWRATKHKGKSNKWSDGAKARYAQSDAHIAQAKEQVKAATAAALALPAGQRGPQNRECLVWELKDPSGNYHVAVGLLPWARENYRLFYPTEDISADKAARRISIGFEQIAMTYRGTPCKRGKPSETYKGWTLVGLPVPKDRF